MNNQTEDPTVTKIDNAQVSAVVVLIHGTWGRGFFSKRPVAEWCDKGSDIRATLRGALGNTTVFESFNWSGGNSPTARLRGAGHLNETLNNLKEQYPSAGIHLVTHSHGGNVAMYCLRDACQQNRIESLICLSTPFLHTRPRRFGSALEENIHILVASLVVPMLVACFVFLLAQLGRAVWDFGDGSIESFVESAISEFWQENVDHFRKHALQVIKVDSLILLILISVPMAFFAAVMVGLRLLRERAHAFSTSLALPETLPCPVLIIRSTADEATTALGGPQFFSSMISLLLRVVMKIIPMEAFRFIGTMFNGLRSVFVSILNIKQDEETRAPIDAPQLKVKAFLWRFFAFTIVVLVSIAVLVNYGYSPPLYELRYSMPLHELGYFMPLYAILAALVIYVGLALAGLALVWLCLIFLALLMLPFGLELALGALHLQVSAEASPPGEWNVTQLAPSKDELEENIGMQHLTHSSREALGIMEGWLSRLASFKGVNSGS